jgi:hypothetical protein
LTYSIPKIRTYYGKFNIRFSGVKVWNEIDDEIKKLKPSKFKAEVKKFLLQKYKECKKLKIQINNYMQLYLNKIFFFSLPFVFFSFF